MAVPGVVAPRRGRQADWIIDAGLAGFVALIQLVGSHFAGLHHLHHHQARPLDGWAYLLLSASPVALLFRRGHPVAVLAATWLVTMAYVGAGYTVGPVWMSLVIAFFNAVISGHRLAGQVALLAGYVVSGWLPPLAGTGRAPTLVAALGVAAWLLVLLSLAEVARVRRERAADARRTRLEEARRQASEERLRIARDLHDVLAHNIALINVQASTALHLLDERPGQARVALSAIKDASKEALVELRSVLGALRQVDEELPRAPAPSVSHLGELVGRAEAAGLPVHVDVIGVPRPLPAGVDQAAFRIVQEALTNVARHAGPASATVAVTYGDGDVIVQVDDDGSGPGTPGTSGGGNGVPGMRERAIALGGQLQAGPRPGGGFRVRAWLPVNGS